MIFHKHKAIFIHIPKCAGSSINNFFAESKYLDWKSPDYKILYGWCPKRKIHLQHATAKELLDLDLIPENIWKSYYKFTFIRNPFDRMYSDYLWIQNDRKIKGTFKDYILRKGPFAKVLNDKSNKIYRGDHLKKQTDFFDFDGVLKLDYVGRFEQFQKDINYIRFKLSISKKFHNHFKRNSSRYPHYSMFYTNTKKKLVEKNYKDDIDKLNYKFTDKKKGLNKLKNLL